MASGPLAFDLEKLAVVRSRYAAAFPTISQGSVASAVNVENAGLITFILQPVPLPTRRTEYFYSTGGDVRWHSMLALPPGLSARFTTGSNRYRPKQMYFSRWNEPPFAPAYPENASLATRTNNVISVATPLFSDRASHAGVVGTNARTTIYRNGERLGEGAGFGAAFTAPPELSTYRVETTATQSLFGLSTQVSGAWTFQSEQPDTAETVDLPLLFVKLEPRLNDLGQAPRGRHYELPVSVRQIGEKDPVAVSRLTIEVSYDDGTSWQRAPLHKRGKEWVARLKHPKNAEYVSLRTTARDYSSNAVEATVIRAYALTDASQDTP